MNNIFKNQLFENNPILRNILGICPLLAVTNLMENALVMGLALIFVTSLSEFSVSLLRNYTDKHVRMLVQVLLIAWFVILVDIVLKYFLPDISKALGAYVGLIITNCIIMGRCEAYAQKHNPVKSFIDGVASGLSFTLVILTIAFFRELMGFGTLFGVRILGDWWTNWGIMSMPAGAFFMVGLLLYFYNKLKRRYIDD